MILRLFVAASLPLAPLLAADPDPRITVTGSASVTADPDRAQLQFAVHGEGTTSDEAVTAVVAKRKAIEAGLASLPGRPEPRSGRIAVVEIRGRDCNTNNFNRPALSTGPCAILGFAADLTVDIRTADVKNAGTMVGLIGRSGGTNPRIERFTLADEAAARRRALAAAFANARAEAEAIAAAAGVKLGRLLTATDAQYGAPLGDIVVTGMRMEAPPAPPPPPPPVQVGLNPAPVETQARVTLSFAILP